MRQTRASIPVAVVLLAVGCAAPGGHVAPVYDERTRALIRLDLDRDGDGDVDTRTYMRGKVPVRTEEDLNADGVVDRWEYVNAEGSVVMVGTSSDGRPGVEDTWTFPSSAAGERRVDFSLAGDRRVDRRELYRGDQRVRVEEDTNGDGVTDKWEVYEAGVLRQVSVDTSFRAGRPDRRVVYAASGAFERLELDPDRDGTFAPGR